MLKSLQGVVAVFLLLLCTACSQQVDTTTQPEEGESTEMSYDQNSWKDIIDESCTHYTDGCNTCSRAEGAEFAACTRKACAVYEKPECLMSTYTLYIDSELVDCVGVGPMKCMMVRTDESEEWQNFYDKIQGFEHQAGNRYALSVKRTKRENVPADASIWTYELVEVISQEQL